MRASFLRRVTPGAAVATTLAAGAAMASPHLALSNNPAADDPDVATALALRDVALRARGVLSDPPRVFTRCARSEWERHAGEGACTKLNNARRALHSMLSDVAVTWKATQRVEPALLNSLTQAADDADEAVRAARYAAVIGAAAVPWGDAMRGALFEHADGAKPSTTTAEGLDGLRGSTVALYFTASWCGPCQRFTPKLVQLYGMASAAAARRGSSSDPAQQLEVVLVSWDEVSDERKAYAMEHGMRWLTLPHTTEMRALADELTLRYDVMAIPTLVVLEVSADGKDAKVLSRDGRMDVERGRAPWMARVLS